MPRHPNRIPHPLRHAMALVAAACLAAGPADGARPGNPGTLAMPPDWARLDKCQRTVSRNAFVRELDRVYAPGVDYSRYFRLAQDHVDILKHDGGSDYYRLHFSSRDGEGSAPGYWRPQHAMPERPANRPLEGVRIAIDPGHIGGDFARIEERWFQVGGDPPVMEGEMTLAVARKLQPMLERLGATVTLVRTRNAPVSTRHPRDFQREALEELARLGIRNPAPHYDSFHSPGKSRTIQWHSELLFYRAHEIRRRAMRVNQTIRPDIVLAIHFNAESWGNADNPDFTTKNHLHVLVNGCYSEQEIALDDNRFEMILRIVQRIHPEEVALSRQVASAMAEATGLPPYVYQGSNAARVGPNQYVYARNLLANRVYECPVVFLEPYVMNNREVYQRIQAGDYIGSRLVAGKHRKSLFQEYADGVVGGLLRHYQP